MNLETHPCVEDQQSGSQEMGGVESKSGVLTASNLGNLDLTKEIWEQLELDTINSVQVDSKIIYNCTR